MNKKTKHILIGAALAGGVAAFGALYLTSARKLMTLALDREEPALIRKGKERIAGSGNFARLMKQVQAAGKTLEELPHEEIEILGQDGTRLIGHWFCPAEPKRVIVAMHGWRSGWAQDFGLIAPFWFEEGCAVLFAEQRGQGNSGGDHMTFGLMERFDCLEWILWADKQTNGALPLYLGGISMGATTILMAGGATLPPSVKGIIADCGFTSPHAIWKHVVEKNLHLPYGLYSIAAKSIMQRKLQLRSDSYSCPQALKNCTVPVLFIHGTDDRFVPVTMTYENYKACAAPKRLLIVPGAEHGTSYLIDQAAYQAAVRDFWRDFC